MQLFKFSRGKGPSRTAPHAAIAKTRAPPRCGAPPLPRAALDGISADAREDLYCRTLQIALHATVRHNRRMAREIAVLRYLREAAHAQSAVDGGWRALADGLPTGWESEELCESAASSPRGLRDPCSPCSP